MKNVYRLLLGMMFVTSLIGFYSCKDFLDEDLTTSKSTQTYETQDGLDKLVIGMYGTLKFQFNYAWSYCTTNYGTDEFSVGNDETESRFNNYTSALNSSDGYAIDDIWDNMYSGIASANTVIHNVPLYYDQTSANYNTRLGEGYFIRAFNYFKLVKQYGGVVLKLDPSNSVELQYQRASEEECYAQIISDFEMAYSLLPTTPAETGRITKWAAAHFLAKAHLFRASELYSSWNSSYINDDLDAVIKYSSEVIEAHPLCNDYSDLWNYTTPDGPNESVSEVILAAQFSNDESTWGRYGNQIHLYYPSIYQNLAGCKRDISGDREFSRLRTTNYSLDVFDRENDSRFWKSFITRYNCNNPSGAPTWGSYAHGEYSSSARKFKGGEAGILYIVNNAGDDRYTSGDFASTDIGYRAPNMFVRYFKREEKNMLGAHGNYGYWAAKSRYVALSKFRDGSRISIANQFGCRDGILARSGEDYLMIAEAYIRKGSSYYSNAISYINVLRERAGYAVGEDRSKNVDGGQAYKKNSYITIAGDGGFGTGYAIYSDKNTYYESNNISTEITTSTKANMDVTVSGILNSKNDFYDELGCTSDADKMLCFLLNERTRELCGELYRWEDLARTKTLEARFKTFNDGSQQTSCAFDPDTHYYRPIPQTFFDALDMTADEKAALQNPGY